MNRKSKNSKANTKAKAEKKTAAKTAGGKSIEDFQKTYDKSYIVPKAIQSALDGMEDDEWLPEVDFVRLVQECATKDSGGPRTCGVSAVDFSQYRDSFEDNIVWVERGKKRIWCGSPELANQLQRMVQ